MARTEFEPWRSREDTGRPVMACIVHEQYQYLSTIALLRDRGFNKCSTAPKTM